MKGIRTQVEDMLTKKEKEIEFERKRYTDLERHLEELKKTHEDDILRIIHNMDPSLAEPDVKDEQSVKWKETLEDVDWFGPLEVDKKFELAKQKMVELIVDPLATTALETWCLGWCSS